MAKKLTAYERCELLYNKINTFQKKEGKVKVSFLSDPFGAQLEMINHEEDFINKIEFGSVMKSLHSVVPSVMEKGSAGPTPS